MPNAPSSSLRVLIVEDNADCASSTALLLGMYGYRAQMVTDSRKALELAKCLRPDVVLLDIRMPGMDGWTLAKEIKEQLPYDKPLLIAITGMGRNEDRQHSAESGIDLHLTKPVDPERLHLLLQGVQEAANVASVSE